MRPGPILILTALIPLGLAGCGGSGADTAPAAELRSDARVLAQVSAAHDHAGHGGEAMAPLPLPELSLYHATSAWWDAAGAERTLGSLAGRVQVVAMVYTSCAYACPLLLLDMKRLEAELGEAFADDVGFVIVSIDPARDSPARLATFAEGARLGPSRWTLLTGDDAGVRELAALLGVRYRESAPGEFIHSNVLTVLDRHGTAVHRQEGLGAHPAETLAAIRQHAR